MIRTRRCATGSPTYKGKFSQDPTVFSAYGWEIINLFAGRGAGRRQGPESRTLNKAIESLTKFPADLFGADEQTFSATNHLGTDRAMLCQIQDGRWKSVSEYLTN